MAQSQARISLGAIQAKVGAVMPTNDALTPVSQGEMGQLQLVIIGRLALPTRTVSV